MAERLIVGVTGASGGPLAMAVLELLRTRHPEVETHLVISRGGEATLRHECGKTPSDLAPFAGVLHDNGGLGDTIASGSYETMGMLIVPCSMKTAAGICCGYSDSLLLRAADVCLKEGRKLVLCARESPLSAVHLRNLLELSRLGAVIAPPVLTYYHRPGSLEELTEQTACRLLAHFGLEHPRPWEGMA